MVNVKKEETLEKLKEEINHCQNCPLYKSATQAVSGEGNPDAEIMLIGEAPGFWEDREGQPFVGEAGRILEELLTSVGLKREEVFIGNVVKHRPPQNRDPLPSEVAACRDWLWRQIKIIDPQLIITLGRFALEEFFPGEKISQAHGKKRSYLLEGKKKGVIPMFHPASVLWNRRTLISLREDFLALKPLLEKFN